MATTRRKTKKAISAVLEPTERTTVIALSSQRQQIIASVNVQIAELDAAMKSLQESYVLKYGLAKATEYRFKQEDDYLILEGFEPPEEQEAEDGESDSDPE